jgi:hypothetical protein
MRYLIIYIALVLFFGCKTENKKEIQKQPQTNEEMTKALDTINNNKVVRQDEEKVGVVKQRNLDYSLKAEAVKTRIDSVLFLKHYFNQFAKEKDSLSEVFFIRMFPDNFKEFKVLYGYEEKDQKTIYGDLYKNDEQLFDYQPKHIRIEEYIKKLIDISIGGVWQADSVNIIQMKINNLFVENSRLFIEILKKKNESEIRSFWKFFFDGPHPENQKNLYNDVLNKLEKIDEPMIPIVKSAYEKAQEDWAEH